MVVVPARSRRRFPRPSAWHLRRIVIFVLLAFALIRVWSLAWQPVRGIPSPDVKVLRVVDGDTFVVDTGDRIRMLGIDTPETVHPDRPVEAWGAEASRFVKDLVEGHAVRLEFDRERFDSYGRVLAYVWIEDRFVNAEILRAGLGRADTRRPLRTDRKRQLEAAEKEARIARRGLWSEATAVPRGGP